MKDYLEDKNEKKQLEIISKPKKETKVAITNVYVRSAPNKNSSKIDIIRKGTVVEIIDKIGVYYKIINGYCLAELFE